jgi:hypothetical protein
MKKAKAVKPLQMKRYTIKVTPKNGRKPYLLEAVWSQNEARENLDHSSNWGREEVVPIVITEAPRRRGK